MKKRELTIILIVGIIILVGCPSPSNDSSNNTTHVNGPLKIGDKEAISIGSENFFMVYANDLSSITIPYGYTDTSTYTLETKFWIAETELTNAIMVEVLQWAYNNGKFSSTVGDHNGLDTANLKYGEQQLIDIEDVDCRIQYDGSGTFTVEHGFELNPVTNITWYGTIMFCNWLTEMVDGNTDNVVYTGIDLDWVDTETIEDNTKTGFRLPQLVEHEYASKYRGEDVTNTVSGYSNPYFTKGDSASGATDNYHNLTATHKVAINSDMVPQPTDEAPVKSLGPNSANTLGLYDMSGNIEEWCFDEVPLGRCSRDSSYKDDASFMQISLHDASCNANFSNDDRGFRITRTEIE